MGGLPEGIKQPPGVQTAYQLADTLRFDDGRRTTRTGSPGSSGFGTYVDQVMALMREGMREGRVHPKVVLQRIPPQVEKQLVDDPTKSGFYSPFTRFPASIPAGRAAAAGRRRAAPPSPQGVLPALKRFHQFLSAEYVPAAPEQVGIWQLPEGERAVCLPRPQATRRRR